MTAIERIYNNLQIGAKYGKYIKNVRFPYFDCTLSLNPSKTFIRWRHYGESANKNTIEDLEWIISCIFKMNPDEFENNYCLKMEA